MSIQSHREFQDRIWQNLGFTSHKEKHCTRYANENRPEDGTCLLYERPGLYAFTVADYTVSAPFSLAFACRDTQLRFGSFYDGRTRFDMDGISAHTSTPASFLVREEKVRGQQFWNAGQHCRGIEFAVFPDL